MLTAEPPSSSRGPTLPALGFVVALAALAALALTTLRRHPVLVTGWPDDPAARRAYTALAHRLPVETGMLRLRAALHDESGGADEPPAPAALAALHAAIEEHPGDPRLHAALGLVELSAHRYDRAERSYRHALGLAPTYGEARLGLGVTLAMEAAGLEDEGRARGLRLRAISQLAAVPEGDPCRDVALYDRALLLGQVGRSEEARRWALDYMKRDPGSPWSLALEREVPEP